MNVAYMTNAWGAVLAANSAPNNANGAYYVSTGPDAQAIREIAEAGYAHIEIFDGNLLAYAGKEDDFRRMLDENSVTLMATYSACNFIYDEILEEELYRVRKTAELAKGLGAVHYAIGGGATRFDGIREDDYEKLGKALDKVCDMLDEIGLVASFHPHMGSLVETPEQLDKVMPHTRISLCPDTGHVLLGGGDPQKVTEKYVDRIKYFHIKDVTKDGMFCPLGMGVIDFKPIIKVLKEKGDNIQYAVECDGWCEDPKEAAVTTYKYLENNLKLVSVR